MTPDHEDDIYRRQCAVIALEHEAASIRLETAKREAESATRTLAMADAIANSMFNRELGLQG